MEQIPVAQYLPSTVFGNDTSTSYFQPALFGKLKLKILGDSSNQIAGWMPASDIANEFLELRFSQEYLVSKIVVQSMTTITDDDFWFSLAYTGAIVAVLKVFTTPQNWQNATKACTEDGGFVSPFYRFYDAFYCLLYVVDCSHFNRVHQYTCSV